MRQRPVLMPGGWPSAINEREACAKALLASGGDFERIFDESELGIDAYVRHVSRVPFFRLAQEQPLVFITGKIQSAVKLLDFYTRLFELTNQFDKASWIAYLESGSLEEFLAGARGWAEVEDLGDDRYCWYTSPISILVMSKASKLTHLKQVIAELEQAPASGVMAVSSPTGLVTKPADESEYLPERKPSSSLSSNSLGRVAVKTMSLSRERDSVRSVTPTPPSNPRIRRVTG